MGKTIERRISYWTRNFNYVMKDKIKSIFIINFILISSDFISKILIKSLTIPFFSFKVIDGFFNIVYVRNKGIAFGLLKTLDGNLRNFFLIYIPLAIIIVVFFYILYSKKITKLTFWGLNLIIAGAIGNLIDRYFYGYVVDFLDFYYKNFHWPAFNFADFYISIGTILLIIDSFVSKKKGD